ncbi:MAG: SDR family oxidoreductase [Rhodospirillaceae bacterium]|nr:SDR family oxidoreductase [Rhodospirillaceae bacterium]
MPTILVTGANRGLGLEFVKQYAADGWHVIACCRNPSTSKDLASIKGKVAVHRLDVLEDQQIRSLGQELSSHAIDIVLNNAGVGGFGDSFGNTDTRRWLSVLHVNCIAPFHVVESFLPHLERGQKKLVVNISSRMGSIDDNQTGGYYSYRSSKAALNMAMKSLAVELKPKGVGVVMLHPGWVRTAMGGQSAPLLPAESITHLRKVINNLTINDSGHFLNYDGQNIPW